MTADKTGFFQKVVQWQQQHGRHDLPWQNTRDPYRVWLSEIMLQQTQVGTVKAYFARFVERLPNVAALAAATQDEVLGLWSGLGYYSRARNLHRCAQQVVNQYGGVFPKDAQTLASLPGIGRSTASAISSLCFGEPVAILDANAKRVVARVYGFDADLARSANVEALWQLATDLIPAPPPAAHAVAHHMARYTQGMMDIGASLCSPKTPQCLICPVAPSCEGARRGDPERYPVRSRTLKRSSQSLWLLWAQSADGAVWLSKRPTPGVWAGLYCLPLFDSEEALHEALPAGVHTKPQRLEPFLHVLTHKDLHLHPWRVEFTATTPVQSEGQWFSAADWPALGLPAPVRKLLAQG